MPNYSWDFKRFVVEYKKAEKRVTFQGLSSSNAPNFNGLKNKTQEKNNYGNKRMEQCGNFEQAK